MNNTRQARNRAWLERQFRPINEGFDEYVADPLNKLIPGQWGNNLKGLLEFSKELSPGMDISDQRDGIIDVKDGLLAKDPYKAMEGLGLYGLGVLGMMPGVGDAARVAGKDLLTREEFYKTYMKHVDLRSRASKGGDATRESILRDGFKKGGNVNATPISHGAPQNVVDKKFSPREGDYVYLVPPPNWKDRPNGVEIQDGWKPEIWEAIKVSKDNPDMYEEYVRAFKGVLDGGPPMDLDDLGFYSPTQRLANNLPEKGVGNQFYDILKKGDGKGARIQEEMQDMGLDTWLKGKGKVTRQEVLDYIEGKRLRYDTKVLGGKAGRLKDIDALEKHVAAGGEAYGIDHAGDVVSLLSDTGDVLPYVKENWEHYRLYEGSFDDAVKRNAGTKYDNYSQLGGTDYQENLLKIPRASEGLEVYEINDGGVKYYGVRDTSNLDTQGNPLKVYEDGYEIMSQTQEGALKKARSIRGGGDYTPPHYDGEPNLALTTRTQSFSTTDGNSVHLMDELQSDWHKDGRTRGYNTPDSPVHVAHEYTPDEFDLSQTDTQWKTVDVNGVERSVGKGTVKTEGEAREYFARWLSGLEREYAAESQKAARKGVPDAPAKQSWVNQGIKKEINQAIQDGKEYYAWTGGDIQADRYSLSKQVDEIDWNPKNGRLYVKPKNSGDFDKIAENVTEDNLSEYVGKEAAEKLINQDVPHDVRNLKGVDLEIGGEGMKSFYDKDVRNRTQKILKQLDPNAKIEVIELENGNKVWGVKITDQMRGKTKTDGMPLYGVGGLLAGTTVGAGLLSQQQQQDKQGVLY